MRAARLLKLLSSTLSLRSPQGFVSTKTLLFLPVPLRNCSLVRSLYEYGNDLSHRRWLWTLLYFYHSWRIFLSGNALTDSLITFRAVFRFVVPITASWWILETICNFSLLKKWIIWVHCMTRVKCLWAFSKIPEFNLPLNRMWIFSSAISFDVCSKCTIRPLPSKLITELQSWPHFFKCR